jgi:hypothetical protein
MDGVDTPQIFTTDLNGRFVTLQVHISAQNFYGMGFQGIRKRNKL